MWLINKKLIQLPYSSIFHSLIANFYNTIYHLANSCNDVKSKTRNGNIYRMTCPQVNKKLFWVALDFEILLWQSLSLIDAFSTNILITFFYWRRSEHWFYDALIWSVIIILWNTFTLNNVIFFMINANFNGTLYSELIDFIKIKRL